MSALDPAARDHLLLVFPSPQAHKPALRVMVEACRAAPAAPNSKERDFLRTLRVWRGTPTSKQMASLIRIYESVS